ncbi:MAG TPA: response regulator [Pirellulales bacterium]|nr:response regulator [Pirellulales bacterium]
MTIPVQDPSILIVDDRADKLLALSAVVADLCPSIVTADSGRQALKRLLERDFALILLDVNMPGMDGFETAALIRKRKNSESTPIIFVTSYGDDMHVAQGYSLGAVDYILSPIVPAVLRTKVSVFLDLYRKTREVELQALRLERRAEQLHQLTQVSLEIHSARSIEKILRVITDTARDVIGVHYAVTVLTWQESWAKSRKVVSHSAEHAARIGDRDFVGAADVQMLWRALDCPRRLTAAELAGHPAWQASEQAAWGDVDRGGWLAAPLIGRDGLEIGLIQLADKREEEFSADDEALLLQLAQMASIAIENILNSEAREANRIKDEFLATLSHELRTPLTAMLGWTQLLRAGALDANETSHGLEIIERNVLSQAKLIDDLLDVSRIITGKLRLSVRPISMISVIEAAIDVVRPGASAKGVRIETGLDAEASAVVGDPDRLQQVIWNLLVNAIKFTPAGGEISVRLSRAESKILVEVADTGEGISSEFLPHIFDRFRQADSSSKRSHGGLGLGLAIVRHVVELHGGSVSAASEGRHRGATFYVTLPVAAVASPEHHSHSGSAASRAPAAAPAHIKLDGLRVLVVDDEADGREAIAKVLELRGADVLAASTVREALALLKAAPPDVLVSDIGLPDEDGYDLIRMVRELDDEQAKHVPAIALTAFAREEDSMRALSAGFQLHASKPIEPGVLTALVARLAGRSAVSAPAASSEDPAASLSALFSEL